jgi:hypothetical protein
LIDVREIQPGEVTELAAATASQDPAVGLAAVAALRGLVDVLEALQVDSARAGGWTWKAIAERLGVSKQAVHQKYGAGRLPFRSGR